jgi:unsaturated chondroitin disaccharide hydrolase
VRVFPLPVLLLVLLLALPAGAAAAPVRTLSVDHGEALSAALTLPAKGKATLEAGAKEVRITVDRDGDDLVVRRKDLGRNRLPRTQRLIVANTDGVTTVTLGAALLARTPARSVRLTGTLRLEDPYASSADDPVDRLAQRAGMLHLARPRTQAYLGQGPDGRLHYREIRNWAAAFLPGLLWQVAAARDSELHAHWAMEEVRDLRRVALFSDADVGFVFWRAAALGRDVACATPVPELGLSPAACGHLRSLAEHAATRLLERAAAAPLGLIPTTLDESQCAQCLPGELRVIVDQLHNLPLLTESADPARRAVALSHARWVAGNLMRPDGAVFQQAFVDRTTGALRRTGNFQGLADTSVWARGQAWAISGLARTARDLEDPELLAAAVRAADWWLANTTSGALPRFDFSAAPDAPRDSSAQAIAGAGLHILAGRCAVTGTCDAARYAAAADVAEATLVARLEPGPQLGRLGEGVYNIGGLRWDESAELPWGTDFLAELLTR